MTAPRQILGYNQRPVRVEYAGGRKPEKRLEAFMSKVLQSEPNAIREIWVRRNEARGGNAGWSGTRIEISNRKVFLHEVAHTLQKRDYCNCSSKGRCSHSHNLDFHRHAFRLYATWLPSSEAASARSDEYGYHTRNAGKVAKEFRKGAEFKRWLATQRKVNREIREEKAGIDPRLVEHAAKVNMEAAMLAVRSIQAYGYPSKKIRWVTPEDFYIQESGDIGRWYGPRRPTPRVYANGEVRVGKRVWLTVGVDTAQ